MALLVLPLLLARALLPVGFMPAVGATGVQLVFCADSGPNHAPDDGRLDGTCPYALSAGAAPPPAVALVAFVAPSLAVPSAAPDRPAGGLSGPRRQTASRAPPGRSLV